MTTQIDQFANEHVQKVLDSQPEYVTSLGRPGADEGTFSDLSFAGEAARADFARNQLTALSALTPENENDEITKAALSEQLALEVEYFEAGEYADINNIASPIQGTAEIFDLMNQETDADWATIARRLSAVPAALAGYEDALAHRVAGGAPTALHQIELAIAETAQKASEEGQLAALAARGASASPANASALKEGADAARAAYARLSQFLKTEVAPHGAQKDAFGHERYERRIRTSTGAHLDLDETYEWGVAELTRIVAEQEAVARTLYGEGVSVAEAMERLNADPARQAHGTEELQRWMQTTADQALADLDGVHFDIPQPLKTIECMIAPSGTGAIYYTGPTSDFSRPGRMWWSVPEGTDTFNLWQEKTTVYHEGVPGHHLQVGLATYLADSLNDWRREMCWNSGSGEGWALYAEGLMAELGYQDDPGDYMGVLDSERLRASRVVLDIGVHLEKPSPEKYRHISPTWNRDVAWEFLKDNVAMDRSFLQFELNRYLGWAGQAPSYKIGHRLWKQMRAEAAQAAGADFDLKAWHMKALSLGSLGLDLTAKVLR
ncbi:DUF885 domain-containing protein [Arcanobacterium wilhelmae]|uniref:DUF885 domain-containing protein n=1 Tax=Arcanobacterium wilhelmae TaxID=1803177 RepID=UPI002414D57E|nr:DUF885 domain-containing protein [Arcanobacterium wilhelmae]WFN90666.1 DUF885 domain-containing protein [Arcanobacterium wilhelmae]